MDGQLFRRPGQKTFDGRVAVARALHRQSCLDNFRSAFERIADGNTRGLDIKALQGREGFRLRPGDYRAIDEIEGDQINVLVLDAGPRGDIYR